MPTKFTDEQLIAKSQHGDKRSFDMLVMRYQGRLLGLVSRYVKDSSEAEDVVQEAFLKAYRSLGSFRGDSTFYTWLCRIGINGAKNYLASLSRRNSIAISPEAENMDSDFVEDKANDSAVTEGPIFGDELLAIVQKTLATMSYELRVALTLREIEGLSYEDIADAMGCPIGTVRSRIFRAREILNQTIKEYME